MSHQSFIPDTISCIPTLNDLSLVRIQYRIPQEYDLELYQSEMDTEAMEMLTKGLYAQRKRKVKAPGESSKRTKVGALSSTAPATTNVALEVAKVIPTINVNAAKGGSFPLESSSPPTRDQALKTPIETEEGKKRKKKRLAVMKIACKARPSEPSNSDGDGPRNDPFDNPNVIWDLIDKFTLPEVVDRMADLDQTELVWSSLGTILKVTVISNFFSYFSFLYPDIVCLW
ncbi:hypothetical protein COCNU_scaffold000525G000090 [Cocos nucifera]|nr:hypothetical protein [Cocos nucifera]